MSGLRAEIRRSLRLTNAAKEEQHRLGHPEINVEHLLLAIVVAGEEGGQALRRAGLTVDRARRAVEAHHRDQLRILGIEAPDTTAASVHNTAAAQTEWAQPALDAMSLLRYGDGALLSALLEEPSGRVAAILHAEQIDSDALQESLRHAKPASTESMSPADDHSVLVRVAGRINARIEDVWELLNDPMRRTEWEDSGVAHIELHPDGSFTTTSPTHTSDGRRVRLSSDRQRILHTPVLVDAPRAIIWTMSYPDRPDATRSRRRAAILEPDGSGTRIWLEEHLCRRTRIWSAHRVLLRLFARAGLTQRIAAIDRTLR